MRLSTTKFALLLVFVVCFISTKVIAHHHRGGWRDDDCDDDDEDWDDEDWDDEEDCWDEIEDRWDEEEDRWDDRWNGDNDWNRDHDWNKDHDWNRNGGGNWNGNNGWGNNGQGWNSAGPQPSGSIVVHGSTIWSGNGWPMPTNGYGQPPYPTGITPGVVTATWTQTIPTGTNIRGEPQYYNAASGVKAMAVPVLLAAIAFSMVIAA